mmetsp:Transcript_131233/g.365753  ORF Transcript_131233/g.365753 Transcript_131233/m.365753 type:complete len:279 (+) Transcript_131233:82-918(+)
MPAPGPALASRASLPHDLPHNHGCTHHTGTHRCSREVHEVAAAFHPGSGSLVHLARLLNDGATGTEPVAHTIHTKLGVRFAVTQLGAKLLALCCEVHGKKPICKEVSEVGSILRELPSFCRKHLYNKHLDSEGHALGHDPHEKVDHAHGPEGYNFCHCVSVGKPHVGAEPSMQAVLAIVTAREGRVLKVFASAEAHLICHRLWKLNALVCDTTLVHKRSDGPDDDWHQDAEGDRDDCEGKVRLCPRLTKPLKPRSLQHPRGRPERSRRAIAAVHVVQP